MKPAARHAALLGVALAAPAGAVGCELLIPDVSPPGAGGAGAGAGPACFPPGPSDEGVPLTPIPPGYGFYCSIGDPGDGGSWSVWTPVYEITEVPDGGFPCQFLHGLSPGAPIERAGLYALETTTSALVSCQTGEETIYTDQGPNALAQAVSDAQDGGYGGCVFTAAPASLPVFSLPYMGNADPVPLAAFNFDLFGDPVSVSAFGQTPSPPGTTACAVDRTGRERCHYGSAAECGDAGAGCLVPDVGTTFGYFYAWALPEGTPALAVADGTVRGSLDRAIPGCDTSQEEIYVEHAVGSPLPGADLYVERFVVGYQGLSLREVSEGDTVHRGQEIGKTGLRGCQDVPSLGFVVLRLTNLAGAPIYAFSTEPQGAYGFNGVQGAIDPFGWAAPEGSDPWALGADPTDPHGSAPCGYQHPGAFSIDLWMPGEAPPTLQ